MIRLICCILVFFPASGYGQKVITVLPRGMLSVHFDYMTPQEPVNRFLDPDDSGYRIELQYRLQHNKPFLGGVYFSDAGLSKYVDTYTLTGPDGDTEIREKARTKRLDFGLTAGFYPELNWAFQPYLLGRVGFAIFQTSSILKDNDTKEDIDRISELTSSVPSYGLDIGMHIVPKFWYIRYDVRFGFVANPSVTFLSLNEDKIDDTGYPIDFFDQHTSSCSWLKVSVGISFLIDAQKATQSE